MELEELKAEIEDLHTKRQFSAIKTILNQLNPADIAQLLEEFSNEERLLFFRLLGKEEAADTFVELEPDNQEALIHAFSDNELREVLDELYLDDTVDMIEEMPATVVKRILRNTDVETRASINTLLRYPEDSAGSIMTPEFVDLKRDMTVEDAFKRIRRTGVDKETIYTCYVTDASRHLLGVTTVKELLLHDQDDRIEAFMETNVIYVNTLSDQGGGSCPAEQIRLSGVAGGGPGRATGGYHHRRRRYGCYPRGEHRGYSKDERHRAHGADLSEDRRAGYLEVPDPLVAAFDGQRHLYRLHHHQL